MAHKKVVFLSLASDFGCQVQVTNFPELLEMLGSIDLSYWQLATSAHMPEDYDVAVIEGAVTTQEHIELLEKVRGIAECVIVVGACACTGGVVGLALNHDLEEAARTVYGKDASKVAWGHIAPRPVDAVIPTDFKVMGCPINPEEFSYILQRAVQGLTDHPHRETLCSECKINENLCFYKQQKVCLGLVTAAGCNSNCVNRGRACTGCRGLAEDANLEAAREFAAKFSLENELLEAIEVYNTARKEA